MPYDGYVNGMHGNLLKIICPEKLRFKQVYSGDFGNGKF